MSIIQRPYCLPSDEESDKEFSEYGRTVDEAIWPYIRLYGELGLKTHACCSGHWHQGVVVDSGAYLWGLSRENPEYIQICKDLLESNVVFGECVYLDIDYSCIRAIRHSDKLTNDEKDRHIRVWFWYLRASLYKYWKVLHPGASMSEWKEFSKDMLPIYRNDYASQRWPTWSALSYIAYKLFDYMEDMDKCSGTILIDSNGRKPYSFTFGHHTEHDLVITNLPRWKDEGKYPYAFLYALEEHHGDSAKFTFLPGNDVVIKVEADCPLTYL